MVLVLVLLYQQFLPKIIITKNKSFLFLLNLNQTLASSGINGIVSISQLVSWFSFCLNNIKAISIGNANQIVCLYLSGTFNGGSIVKSIASRAYLIELADNSFASRNVSWNE